MAMSFKIGDRVILKKETYLEMWADHYQLFLDTEYVVTRIDRYGDIFIKTTKEEYRPMNPSFLQFSSPWGALLCNCRDTHTFTPKCLDCVPKHYP